MDKEKRVVIRRSPEEWRTIIARFERSGMTCRQFCATEALAVSTFWWWRRKLDGPGPDETAAFVELVDDRPAAPAWDAELDLGDGLVLRLRRAPRC